MYIDVPTNSLGMQFEKVAGGLREDSNPIGSTTGVYNRDHTKAVIKILFPMTAIAQG